MLNSVPKFLIKKLQVGQLANRSGQALIQVMVAAGVFAVISMGVLSALRPDRTRNFQTDSYAFANLMLSVISNPVVCSAAISGLPPNTQLHFTGFNSSAPNADSLFGQELSFTLPFYAAGVNPINSVTKPVIPGANVQVGGFYFKADPGALPNQSTYQGDLLVVTAPVGLGFGGGSARKVVGKLIISVNGGGDYTIAGCSSPLTPQVICTQLGGRWFPNLPATPCRFGITDLCNECAVGQYITALTPSANAAGPCAVPTCAAGNFMCPCDIDPATGLPKLACADNQRQTVIGIDPSLPVATPGWPLVCQPIHRFEACSLAAGSTSWTVGANTCFSDNTVAWAASAAGTTLVAIDQTAPIQGAATYTCTLVAGKAVMTGPTGATCGPPAICSAAIGALSWVDPVTALPCTNDVAVSISDGGTQVVTNNTPPNQGAATFTCTAGVFNPYTLASCVPSTCTVPAGDPWVDSVTPANNCFNDAAITIADGAVGIAYDNTAPLTGQQSYSCAAGVATPVAGSNTCGGCTLRNCIIPAGTKWSDPVNKGNSCVSDAAVTILPSSTGTLNDTLVPVTGSVQYSCDACGNAAPVAGTNSCAATTVTGYCEYPSDFTSSNVPYTPSGWYMTTLHDCLAVRNAWGSNAPDQQVNPGFQNVYDNPLCPNCIHFYPIGTSCWDGDGPAGTIRMTMTGQGGSIWNATSSYGTQFNCFRAHNHMNSNRYYSCATGEHWASYNYYASNDWLTGGGCWGSPTQCVGARSCPETFHIGATMANPTVCNNSGTVGNFACPGLAFTIGTSVDRGTGMGGTITLPTCASLALDPVAANAACTAATQWSRMGSVKCFSQQASFVSCVAGNFSANCACL